MLSFKPYLTIDEQIELLGEKGLIIKNKKIAKRYLNDIGYYKLINTYREHFIYYKSDKGLQTTCFYEGTTIEDLYELYHFDHTLRGLIFKYISEAEIKIKSRISDLISTKYGTDHNIFLQEKNFKPDSKKGISFIDLFQTITREIIKQENKKEYLAWYKQNYTGYPMWILNNILPLGTISLMYSKLKQPDQYLVSNYFGLKSNFLENGLALLALFRNVSAHNERLYNYKTLKRLPQNDIQYIFDYLKIQKVNNQFYRNGLNDFLAVIIILSFILDKTQYNEFISQLKSCVKKFQQKLEKNIYLEILQTMGLNIDFKNLSKLQDINKINYNK